MKILFASGESHPFLKTGGLGDVAYALPKALRKLGVDARVIMPKYSKINSKYKDQMTKLYEFYVPVGWRYEYCGIYKLVYDDVPFYFLDNEYYFDRAQAYGEFDDGERFAYFSKAILDAIVHLDDFIPDILHCNDWHTAMAIPLLQEHFQKNGVYEDMRTIFTIHNLKFQGVFGPEMLTELLDLDESWYAEEKIKFYDGISYMKGGIMFANAVSTVSPTYAQEIQSEYFGEGLQGLLQSKKDNLFGITNGIDVDLFNPSQDESIFYKFDVNSIDRKALNKEELQRVLGLPVNKDIPIITMVTRLTEQKGLDLVAYMLEELLQENIQIVILGTGDKEYEDVFKYFAWKYPNKMSSNIYFDANLANKIYASSDMFLMPSRFEPCGLGQLISLRYGTIPVVRETGGLNDTVQAYNEFIDEGNGFSFTSYNAHDLLYSIRRAIGFYWNKNIWDNLVKRAMEGDYSWEKSAKEYIDMYHWVQTH
ncbi:glycogen synthase GlgA [Clostridium sp. DL1XJH146]